MTYLAPQIRRVVDHVARSGLSSFRSDAGKELSPVQAEADLARMLYDRFHARWDRDPGFRVTNRDLALESELKAATRHGATRIDVQVIDRATRHIRVALEGVAVILPKDAPITDSVEQGYLMIPAARPALSPGFFLADGSRGKPRGERLARFYVHLHTIRQAIGVWQAAVSSLEDLEITYRAKIASSEGMFPRADAMVIYCDAEDAAPVREKLAEVLTSHLRPDSEGSVFTEQIRPGFAYAEEPKGLAGETLSFGQHRCRALARAFLRAEQQGWIDTYDLVALEFESSRIDPARPWLGLDNEV